jgi:hypothetical protein
MSPVRVLIAVSLAALLVAAAFFVLRRPASDSAAPPAFLQFDPARARGLTVTRPDGSVERLIRVAPASETAMSTRTGDIGGV